jgi:hypothetical protein
VQRFAPEGSTAAEGIVNQLGTPSLAPLTVLVREAVQNTWDARRDAGHDRGRHAGGRDGSRDGGGLEFRLTLRTLGTTCQRWRELLLPGPDPRSGVDLAEFLTRDTPVLIVSDRGTVGLGGPLRAGQRPTPGQRSDFVQFIRNIGELRDSHLGGGTYGFGKGIFFRVSRTATIVVDTHTNETGPAARRLIGTALGASWYDSHDQRHTGRHWWGEVVDDIPDPILGADAAETAAALGLPGFDDGATGTDIAIIAPDLGTTPGHTPRTPRQAGEFLVSSLLWHLWPKAVPDADGLAIRFEVEVEDQAIEVPDPARVPDLEPYVRALQRVRTGDAEPYRRTVPPKDAGRFAMEVDAVPDRNEPSELAAARPFTGPTRHVARMRAAELVVDYLEGPPHPHPRLQYGAVFKASAEADPYFAAAEPPTHDGWVEAGLTGTTRGVVQRARTFALNALDAALAGNAAGGDDTSSGLGALSARLSGLVMSTRDPLVDREGSGSGSEPWDGASLGRAGGARRAGSGARSPGPGRNGRAHAGPPRLLGAPTLLVAPERLLYVARVFIPAAETDRRVTAEIHVVVDGHPERQPPVGAETPRVIGWAEDRDLLASGRYDVEGSDLVLGPGPDAERWVAATHLPDVVVSFRVRHAGGQPHAR